VAAASAAPAAEPTAAQIDATVLLGFPAHPHSGFSLAIVHGGRIVYRKGYGLRDAGTPDRFIPNDQNYYGEPFARPTAPRAAADAETIYAIGSVTRQFTAAAILLLSEEHRLGLEDPVGKYVPEFSDPALTLRVLLAQRSGIPDNNTLIFLQRVRPLARRPDGTLDAQRVNRELAALPRDFAPGARFEYSNANYFVLGSVVERVAHQPLGAFLAARIFAPLGMTRTAYATRAAADDVAVGYRIDDKGVVLRAYPWDLAWLGGAAALTSTVDDLARWDVALLDHRVLSEASLAEMWRGQQAEPGQGSYAMGWIVDAVGSHRYLWHNGQVGGFHALNVIFPDDDLAFAILANNQDAKPEYLVAGIARLYFPLSGLDRVLPHSAVALIEACAAVAVGALAISIVAIATFKRFIVAGVFAGIAALVIGFFAPSLIGFVWGGLAALVPVASYALAVRFIPRSAPENPQGRRA
jgi:CubicO group peptidase (beta-lactamase class C family)